MALINETEKSPQQKIVKILLWRKVVGCSILCILYFKIIYIILYLVNITLEHCEGLFVLEDFCDLFLYNVYHFVFSKYNPETLWGPLCT